MNLQQVFLCKAQVEKGEWLQQGIEYAQAD